LPEIERLAQERYPMRLEATNSSIQPAHLVIVQHAAVPLSISEAPHPVSPVFAKMLRLQVFGMLELVASSLIGYLLLGQTLDSGKFLGCLLVLAGIVIISLEQLYRASRLPI